MKPIKAYKEGFSQIFRSVSDAQRELGIRNHYAIAMALASEGTRKADGYFFAYAETKGSGDKLCPMCNEVKPKRAFYYRSTVRKICKACDAGEVVAMDDEERQNGWDTPINLEWATKTTEGKGEE